MRYEKKESKSTIFLEGDRDWLNFFKGIPVDSPINCDVVDDRTGEVIVELNQTISEVCIGYRDYIEWIQTQA